MSKSAKGFIWSSIDRFSVQGVSFLLSIIIARLVSPSSYGLIVMIQVFMTICQTFIDGGFANALIQKKERKEEDFYTAFIFNLSVAIFLYIALFISAPLIASFYEEPQLTLITRVLGLNLIFSSLSIVQKTKLTIDLNFKLQAKAGLLAVIFSGSIGVICAYKGYEVWALVVQGLASNIFISFFLFVFSRWTPKLIFSSESFRHLFGFGSKLLLANLSTSIYLNIYNLVIGKRYSSADLAYYNRAFTLTQIPSTNVEMVLSRIIYPLECRLQDDPKELKTAYFKYLHLSNFVVVPMMLLLASLATPTVRVLLTDKWLPAVPYIVLYAINFALYPWLDQSVQLLNVVGETGINLKTQIYKRLFSFIILIVTIPFGVYVICIGVLLSTVIELLITLFTDRKVLKITLKEHIQSQLDVYIISVIMFVIVYSVCLLISDPFIQLFIGGFVGLFVYMSMACFMRMQEIEYITNLIKKKR